MLDASALIDDETRFWISKEVAKGKFTADITPIKPQPASFLSEMSRITPVRREDEAGNRKDEGNVSQM